MSFFAQLRQDSPWFPLFPGGLVPIRGAIPQLGEMVGDGVQGYFEVDTAALSVEQLRGIAAAVAMQCGGTPVEVLADTLERGFIPLRARHVDYVSFA